MTRVLVVTPWGDPSNWSRATYRIPTIINEFKFRGRVEREFIDSGTHYRSVLGALLESLTTKSFSVKPLIIISDTLSARSSHIYAECIDLDNYDKVRECAKKYLMKFLRGERRDEYVGIYNVKDSEVIVAPGFGSFRDPENRLIDFQGFPENYYVTVLVELLINMLEYKPDNVILDLSHGINYMPLLTREAIVEASKIYTILYDTELGLITLNSDPIPSERAGVEPKVFRSRLNVIDYKYFKRKDSIDDAYSMLNKLGIGGQFVLANIEEKKAADQLGRVKKDLQYKLKVKQVIDRGILISKASKLGFALLIAYELKELDVIDVEHFRNTLEFLKNEFINGFILKNTAVVNQGEVIEVRHGVRANVGYVEAYIESLALQTAISSIPKEDPPYSLAYLSSIKEALIIRDPARTLVEYELIDIEKRVSRVYSECIDYRGKMILYKIIHEIYDKISSEEGRVQCTSIEYEEYENSCHSIEKRVLYAHAGLQKEVINVLVETSQNNIRLEYSRECRDKVKELVLKEPIA